ncbi:MAG: thiamine-phosphate kinase [Hyphomicrobiales bacterium]|nr:thiamine-phosphate kinase [Hyphomicrobiales bacterium]MDE2017788.1 thiamine-phosphate kinase [Hyphomicrobiales bacterium]
MSGSGEDDLIARHFAPWAAPGGLGLRDDAALVAPGAGEELVVTADALVAGVHFHPDDPPETVAKKALRVNLSDLAAKGAEPRGFLLALALPKADAGDWLARFAQGLREDAAAFRIGLLGGDTVSTPGPAMIAITAIGAVPTGRMVRRSGARPGDAIYVTGTIGDAALGLSLHRSPERFATLGAQERAHLADRYLLPKPRVGATGTLRRVASAAMDVSDGLVGDVIKLCSASGVTARIALADVPLSDAARAVLRADVTLFETVVTGGDDYEILFTSSSRTLAADAFGGVIFTRIGFVEEGRAPARFSALDGAETAFKHGNFSHF